jgi:hypothetical protein
MASGRDIGGEFAAALRAADFAAIGRCLSPAVQLRALLPGGMVDAAGRAAAVAMLGPELPFLNTPPGLRKYPSGVYRITPAGFISSAARPSSGIALATKLVSFCIR